MFSPAFRSKYLLKSFSPSFLSVARFSKNDQTTDTNDSGKATKHKNKFKEIYEKADDPEYLKLKSAFLKVLTRLHYF